MKLAAAVESADKRAVPPTRQSSGSGVLWLIVLLAAVAAILSYRAFENRLDQELRIAVLKRLAELFPQARVKLDRVSIQGTGKIVVHGLKVATIDGKRLRQILAVDRIELSGDLDIAHFVQETVKVHRIDVYHPQAELWKLASGQWSLMALVCQEKKDQPTPRIQIHQGDLRLYRGQRDSGTPIVIHDIAGSVGEGKALENSPIRPLEGKFTARSSGSCEELAMNGWLDRSTGHVSLQGSIEQLSFSHELVNKLPLDLSRSMTQLAGLSCKAGAGIWIDRATAGAPWRFTVRGKLGQGRLNDSRLPYPLDELSGDFYCNNQSLQLRQVKARSGQATCTFDADINGFHPQAPVSIRAEVKVLQLDGRLYNARPPKWRAYWERVQPEGYVDALLTLNSDGVNWTPHIELLCRDVQLECWLFPYPLTKVVGNVIIERDRLIGQSLKGRAGGQPITGGFNFQRIAEEWYGNLQIKGDGPVTIDDKVLTALTVRGQPTGNVERFVRSLEPSGTFKIEKANFTKKYGEGGFWHKDLAIVVSDCSMLYQGFRYPLYKIHGRIEAQDDHWQLMDFEGWNDSGRIQCSGDWQDQHEAGIPFQLAFTAHSLAMEDELQHALPIDARQLWDQLQPRGSIDRADVKIVRPTGDAKVQLEVVLHEDNHSGSAAGQSLQLRPKAFPYWLSDVACDLTYRPGRVEISQASANNTNSRVSIRAQCEQNAAGNWVGTVNWLPPSRVMVDTQLLRALPDSISQGLIQLDMRGPINITGLTNFELPIDGVTAPTTELNLQLELEDVQLGDGKMVDGIRGSLRLAGRRDPSQITAVGWADIDAMSLRGVPMTNVRGPLALSGNQVFFGSEVAGRFSNSGGAAPAEITANALSGQVMASGSGQLDTGRFQVNAKLVDADFRCMLQDLGASSAPTDARCNVELSMAGIPWQTQTYSGSGAIHLRDAQLYQLPTMIRLLRVLSVAPTDKAAFHTADIAFSIDGDRIPLKLACEGDLLSLRGQGSTNFRKELDLELYSYVGGRVPVSSVLSPLIAETPYASFMSLAIDGTLDNPQIEKRAFPQWAVLQQFFPDKVASTEDTSEGNRLLDRWRR
ncbi:MAG: hypothetical protein IT423_19100 [Pirellulaceae bacterium]|nr:hypothetical protein [Pirellulaceae bacterium]